MKNSLKRLPYLQIQLHNISVLAPLTCIQRVEYVFRFFSTQFSVEKVSKDPAVCVMYIDYCKLYQLSSSAPSIPGTFGMKRMKDASITCTVQLNDIQASLLSLLSFFI